MFSHVLKANPYHDKDGKFTSKERAGGWTAYKSPDKSLSDSADRLDSHFEQLLTLQKHGAEIIRTPEGEDSQPEHLSLDEAAKQFDHFTGGAVTVQEYMDTMLGKGWEKHKAQRQLDFRVDENGDEVMTIRQVGGKLHGSDVKWFEHSISRNSLDAHLDYIKVADDQRGGGAAKAFFRESTPMMRKMGLDTLSLQANLDAGGYCWARFGFQSVNKTQIKEEADRQSGRLGGLLMSKSEIGLPQGAKDEVTSLKWLHDYVAEERPKDGMRLLTDPKTPELDRVFAQELAEKMPQTKNPTVTKWLAKGGNWHAKIDLKDKEQTDRFGEYLGISV